MIHSKFSVLLLTFMSWYDSCVSCPAPQADLPSDPDATEEPDPDDTSEDTFDIPPPEACDFPEEEFNNEPSTANEIETELWACGVLAPDAETGDVESATDFVVFTAPESGWISMWARGEDIGSYADLQMTVTYNRSSDAVFVGSVKHSPGTMDPKVAVPVEAGDVIDVGIVAENFSGTDQQLWEFLPTILKAPPVYWNVVEDEPVDDPGSNDTNALAFQVLQSGDSVFGTLGVGDAGDTYLIEIPEGSSTIHVDIEAYDGGSPLDSRLALSVVNEDYDPSDEDSSPYTTKASDDNGPGADLDPDPEIELDTTEDGTWRVRVTNRGTFASKFHWYVLHVTVADGPELDSGTP